MAVCESGTWSNSDRGPVLMELELIEPDLFLDPGSAERMAAAIMKTS